MSHMTGLGNQSTLPCESSNDENDVCNCSATLLDLQALYCPHCADELTTPILQCDNGHMSCLTCCNKLRNKCPSCALPFDNGEAYESSHWTMSYGKELTHEKECTFLLCSCPARNCSYTGSYKDLYSHFLSHECERGYNYWFTFGNKFTEVYFVLTEYTSVVMKEYNDGLLFVVQCFTEPHGVYVTVSCIAPSALEVGEFSCHISTVGKYNMTFDLPKVKRIRKLNFQTPEEDFMLVPTYFLHWRHALKLRMCISKLNQE